MTKEHHSAIMNRSRYRKKLLKDKSQTRRVNYKIQRNLCKKILRKRKKSYFESFNIKKSQIIEPSGKMFFLFSQKRRLKVKRFSRKTYFRWLKACTFFDNFFTNVSDCNYSSPPPPPTKKNTHTISLNYH